MQTSLSMNIKVLRESRGLSRKDLASALGVSPLTARNYEQGINHPSEPIIQSLCRVLDVRREELTTDPPVPGARRGPRPKNTTASPGKGSALEGFELVRLLPLPTGRRGRGEKAEAEEGQALTGLPRLIIRTLDGREISAQAIWEHAPEGADEICVMPEEGKAAWRKGSSSGEIPLWR